MSETPYFEFRREPMRSGDDGFNALFIPGPLECWIDGRQYEPEEAATLFTKHHPGVELPEELRELIERRRER